MTTAPERGTRFGRIPVTKVSPVIEGGAYPAKASVGETIPIRATVFREGHDAVNASVVLTDPQGREILDPATGELVGRAPEATVEDLERALDRARSAQAEWWPAFLAAMRAGAPGGARTPRAARCAGF